MSVNRNTGLSYQGEVSHPSQYCHEPPVQLFHPGCSCYGWLVQELHELAELTREQKARICGYSAIAVNETEYVDVLEFVAAVLEARGIPGEPSIETLSTGRCANSDLIRVKPNGSLEIDASHIHRIGLQPGDTRTMTYEGHQIQLNPTDITRDHSPSNRPLIAA